MSDTTYHEIPQEFIMYLSYCRSLKFDEKPDYIYINSLLKDIMLKENYQNDFIFEWTILNYSSHKQLSNKLLEEIKRNAKLDESKQVNNESNFINPDLPAVPQNSVTAESNSKKKCVIF